MVSGMVSRLARVRITVGYAVALAIVAITLLILGPQVQDRVIRQASTNLHNLGHGQWGTLIDSAFVVDAGPVYVWLPGLACLLALAELLWRSGRLVVAFSIGHIGATLLVSAGLFAAVEIGWLPLSITHVSDVGMSYGAAGVLGTLTAAIPRRWRPAWIGWWLSAAVVATVVGEGFTDAGHGVALVLGMLVATRFGRPARWTRARYLLLTVSMLFGFVVLAHTEWSVPTAIGIGAVGALAADRFARRAVRRSPTTATLVTPAPVPGG